MRFSESAEFSQFCFPSDVAEFENVVESITVRELEELDLELFRSVAINGVLPANIHAGALSFSDSEITFPLADLLEANGEWFGIFRDDQNVHVVLADYFGFANVYYGQRSDGVLVIGSSFRAVCHRMQRFDGCGELEFASLAPTVSSVHTLFGRRFSKQTFRRGVYALNADEAIIIRSGTYSVVRRRFSKPAPGSSYSDLIAKGIERASKQIKASVAFSKQEPVVGLSGGRDSRTVLSLIHAADSLNSINVISNNPMGYPAGATRDVMRGDLHYASRIVERFGLNWQQPKPSEGYRFTVTEAVDRFQHIRSHQSFEIEGSSTIAMKRGFRTHFYGANGEMLRGQFAVGMLGAHKSALAGEDLVAGFRRFYAGSNPKMFVPHEVYSAGEALFVRAFLSSAYFRSYFDSLSRFFDVNFGRLHHAITRKAWETEELLVNPLCQPEFIMAKTLLDPTEQGWGKLQFDIMRSIDPAFVTLGLNGDQWDRELTKSLPSDTRWNTINGSGALSRWEENSSVSPVAEIAGVPRYDIQSGFGAELARRVDRVFEYLPDWLLKTVAVNSDFSNGIQRSLLAKIATVEDALGVSDAAYSVTRFSSEQEHLVTQTICIPGRFERTRKQYSMGDVNVGIEVVDRNIEVWCENLSSEAEVAIYLFKDGSRVSTAWYSEYQNPVSFEIGGAGIYRAQVFVRRKGAPRAQMVVESGEQQVV